MKTIIFLGPTLPLENAKAILPDAIYLPPVGQADLLSAVTTFRPDVIGLIDGVFSQSLSVWHKEILYALENGVRVYGASSMGALRAVETDVFGMVGIGKVYAMFKNGVLNDDDEVALVYGQDGSQYLNLSIPMVNIRATIERAVLTSVIDQAIGQKIISLAKALYYPERMFPVILRRAEESGIAAEVVDALRKFIDEGYVDIKKADAIELLETIKSLPEPLAPQTADFKLTHSHLFEALYDRDRAVRHNGIDVPLDAISNYVALHQPDFLTFNSNALNRTLVLVLAELLDIQLSEEAVEDETRRFRIRLRLKTTAQFVEWLGANDLSETEFGDLMKEQALIRALQRWIMMTLHLRGETKSLLDALRLQDRYTEWADKAAQQEAILTEQYPTFLQTDHSDIQIEKLLYEHLQETDCRMDVHYPTWLEDAGFDNARHLWLELLKAKLARDWAKGAGHAHAAYPDAESS